MAKLFGKNNGQINTKENNLETRYKNSIGNLLVVVVFSVVNICLLLSGTDKPSFSNALQISNPLHFIVI